MGRLEIFIFKKLKKIVMESKINLFNISKNGWKFFLLVIRGEEFRVCITYILFYF